VRWTSTCVLCGAEDIADLNFAKPDFVNGTEGCPVYL
jgi:hypothetical protein